ITSSGLIEITTPFGTVTSSGNFTVLSSQNYYAVADGDWNNASTWALNCSAGSGGAGVPTAIDNVTICSGRTVTNNIANQSCNNLIVEGILYNDLRNLTIEGTTTVTGSLEGLTTTVTFKNNIVNEGTISLDNTSITNFSAASPMTITDITNGGITLFGTTTANCNITLNTISSPSEEWIEFASLSVPSNTITNNGNARIMGSLTGAGTWTNADNSKLYYENAAAPAITTFDLSGADNEVIYCGGDQDILGGVYQGIQFWNEITRNGITPVTKTLQGAITQASENKDIAIGYDATTAGTVELNANGNTMNIFGNFYINGGVGTKLTSGATITFEGNNSKQMATGTNANIPFIDIGNLQINKQSGTSLTIGLDVNVGLGLDLINGTLNIGSQILTLSKNVASVGGFPFSASKMIVFDGIAGRISK
ncbi:MAG: hypothetical protein ACOVOV_09710, partial [Dolichospermum sp.]